MNKQTSGSRKYKTGRECLASRLTRLYLQMHNSV